MNDTPRHPLLNPVLRLTREAEPRRVSGGGKSESNIMRGRLGRQREVLVQALETMSGTAAEQPIFNEQLVIHATMFDDSLAQSYIPKDLFGPACGAHYIVPHRNGYLFHLPFDQLDALSDRITRTASVKELVDISRVQNVTFFNEENVIGDRTIDSMWKGASQNGQRYVIWLMPLHGVAEKEHLIEQFLLLQNQSIIAPPSSMTEIVSRIQSDFPAQIRRNLMVAARGGNRIEAAARNYLRDGRADTTVIIPSMPALIQLISSGTILRIDPVTPIHCTAAGGEAHWNHPLPSDMSVFPIVGVVDGGMTEQSYESAEAWRAPPFIPDDSANSSHGNQVTSMIVHGHDWNEDLNLSNLYCRVGTVQAVPKSESQVPFDLHEFLDYLDILFAAAADTKVWNFSFSQREYRPPNEISPFAHGIAVLARKHNILPVIAVGNQPGINLYPPADCEAAITVGGRQNDENGNPAGECQVSVSGPGPSGMLKPDVSQYSKVRVVGDFTAHGSSFSTALISPVAAHTMSNLIDSSPDMAKALLIHNSDLKKFSNKLGFGTPATDFHPWECRPGFATLIWKRHLQSGTALYWEIPIPNSLRRTGKLKGFGSLTAILNPHPLVSEIAGANYFGARLETALQFKRGKNKNNEDKFISLLGSLEKEAMTEREARDVNYKWSPVRHFRKSFNVEFDGDDLRVYARLYKRDLQHYTTIGVDQDSQLEAVFVLSLGTGHDDDDTYNEILDKLGMFAESAVIDPNLEIGIL